MAQVEYVAVLSTVLRRCRVGVSKGDAVPGVELRGEEAEGAKRVLEGCLKDSALIGPTFTMKRPGDVWVQCFERE